MKPATGFQKVAWIHDGKPGERSAGHFICPCGQRFDGIWYGVSEPCICACGRTIDNRGNISV